MSEHAAIEADVVVLGAGFAGLTAAREVVRAGRSALVLEARDRVGGRVHTLTLDDGTPVDLGGQWFGPTQDRAYALARELGRSTFPMHVAGQNLLRYRGKLRRFRGTVPLVPDPAALPMIGWALYRLDALAREVPVESPWSCPRAAEWDAETLESWMRRNVRAAGARALVRVGLETVFACDLADVSLLHVLFYIRSAGGLDPLLRAEGGAQQDRIVGGMQPVAEALAAQLGSRVRLGAPARRIRQDECSVTVEAEGVTVRARRAIVALPPTLAGRLVYEPILPAARDQLTQRLPQGSCVKCVAVYDAPFWRHRGLSGQAVSDEGPVHVTFDASPPDGRPGVLLGFLEGNAARELTARGEAERRREVLGCFERYFGPEARDPRAYLDKAWAEDEWSRGAYAGYFPPGVWTSLGRALREPVGRLHWAGTETATAWNGYIEGAIQSGERAAAEVLAAAT